MSAHKRSLVLHPLPGEVAEEEESSARLLVVIPPPPRDSP